ncbi:MAG: glucan biosynthesis protein, partial [Alphaproteobacteria bacterium]
NDFIRGEDGADTLLGDSGNDNNNGGDDNDRIFGGSGDDALNGDGGIDFLDGSGGMDTYNGGAGNDRLSSRLDGVQDTFQFDVGTGSDRVFRYEAGIDRIGLSADFGFADGAAPPDAGEGLAYSGFRLRFPLNSPDVMDEVAVFQGASYFRAIARSLIYGLSARGLAIRTADPKGEEFPQFTAFWIYEPAPAAPNIRVQALLESPSVVGAFDFDIRPGDSTVMEIHC